MNEGYGILTVQVPFVFGKQQPSWGLASSISCSRTAGIPPWDDATSVARPEINLRSRRAVSCKKCGGTVLNVPQDHALTTKRRSKAVYSSLARSL